MRSQWDVVIVGAGPAGAAAALGVLRADPSLAVALLDRDDFPRDKSCGDGIAPHVFDLLADVGVTGLTDDLIPVRRLQLQRGPLAVGREMARPAWVIPRTVFDHRLLLAALDAGATLIRHRVRSLQLDPLRVDDLEAKVLVGADGAHSVVRRMLGVRPGPMALAIRGYAPTPPDRAGVQLIVFGTNRQPSYAWSFDRGDGLANIGYGESLPDARSDRWSDTRSDRRPRPTRRELLSQLDRLLPGAAEGATDWRAHHLPLAVPSWRAGEGRVLLAGDAAGLVNPMTGEGIYYAVATGLLAGQAAAEAVRSGDFARLVPRYRRASRALLGKHFRHTALSARLCRSGKVLDAGIRAAAADQRVFDDLVELGLANGRITPATIRGLATHLRTRPS
ncbi:geranylgeranyl reductase family protein [Kribbella sp. NBC_01245]|uniref:NAD(P)/FAD-dependent oxidoreductase n=1 Tax=Kribbella sp. NBC_01245 TaxID=2903578 RepID=UPI002E2B1003|nr:geranylgeranyl reductase family protein [Kribbella sp. NBC_01245]